MMSDFITKYRVLAGKLEATPGSVETLASADFDVRVLDPQITLNVEMDMDPTKYSTGDFGLGESVPGTNSASIAFQVKGVNNGTGTDEPNFGKFLKGCGMNVATITSGSGLSFMNSGVCYYCDPDKAEQSLTLGIYDKERGANPSGLEFLMAGCMGNVTIGVEGAGKPYMYNFEYMGSLESVSDISEGNIPALTSPQTTIPDTFLNGSGSIGGVPMCFSTMELNLNNTVSPVHCMNATTGIEKYGLTNQEPSITLNPKLTRETDYDFWTKFTAGTVEEVIIETSQFRIQIPRAQIVSASVEDADGILRTPLTLRALRPSSSDAVTAYSPIRLYVINDS